MEYFHMEHAESGVAHLDYYNRTIPKAVKGTRLIMNL